MDKFRYTFVGLLIAVGFWLLDSTIHYLVFEEHVFEIIPSDGNELWMRASIFVLLVGLGYFTDKSIREIADREEEKERVFRATVTGAQHVLFRVVNNLIQLKAQALDAKIIDEQKAQAFDHEIQQASLQLTRLEKLTDISEDRIREIILHENDQ